MVYTIEDCIKDFGEIPLCRCGCNQKVNINPLSYEKYKYKGYPKFISGHNRIGTHHAEESKLLDSENNKGRIPWNKGKSCSEETKIKISKKCKENAQNPDYIHPFKGKHHTKESIEINRQKHIGTKYAEGHVLSEENKKIISERNIGNTYAKGCIHSEESNLKQSISMKGRIPWNKGLKGVQVSPMKGKHHSPETIEKIKQNTPVKCGEDHPMWQGGISYAPYCPKFNDKKKEEIRNKYNRCCILCGKHESQNVTRNGKQIKLDVHHIDYNKDQGCKDHKWMLAPLCISCHRKTNNKRELWEPKICEILINIDKNAN